MGSEMCIRDRYSAIQTLPAYLAKDFIDEALIRLDWRTMFFIAVVLMIAGPVSALAMFGKENLRRLVGFNILIDIRQQLGEKLLIMSVGFFSKRRVGELMSRVTNDIMVTNKALEFIFGDIIRCPLIIAMALVIAFMNCWQLALIVFGIMPILIMPIGKLGKKITKRSRKTLEKLADVTESMQQMFTGIRIVKAFRLEKRKGEEFRNTNLQFLRKTMRVVRAKALSKSFIELMYIWGSGAVLFIGWYMIKNGLWGMTIGTLGAFLGAMITAYKPAKTLVKAYNTLRESLAGCERIFHLIDLEPEIKDAPDAIELGRIKHGITFKNVWFAYNNEPVLKNINLEVRKGGLVAIVGRSGAGKSTLCDLIMRFYDPTEGSIYIDDIDIKNVTRSSLLDRIAVVTQDPFLFNTTIKENIGYGKHGATDDEIMVAARAANIHDFIMSLEMGYDTIVGERGVKLSGGQKQRITIARAILKDASILILDEATSSLDSESEQAVQAASSVTFQMSVDTHDDNLRRNFGRKYTRKEVEQTIGSALAAGCRSVRVFFGIGLPGQDEQSVMETVAYCGELLDKFGAEKKFYPCISPLLPYIEPGAAAFESPAEYGYENYAPKLKDCARLMREPTWSKTLGYSTNRMDRETLVKVSYKAAIALNRAHWKHGLIPRRAHDMEEKRLQKEFEGIRRGKYRRKIWLQGESSLYAPSLRGSIGKLLLLRPKGILGEIIKGSKNEAVRLQST